MIPECIGFFEKGEMIERIKDGSTEVGGTIPINTLGGVLGRGHPALTTPIYEMIDVLRQLFHEAGTNQVKDAETGFMQCEGGLTNNIFVTILKREVGKR
jgi:acetyl-CoA acetyltransferase